MKTNTVRLLLLPFLAALTITAGATPATTDEARAEAGQHYAQAAHATALAPLDAQPVRVTDTDSARAAAALTHRRAIRNLDRADTGVGVDPSSIVVSDTDSARAAAARQKL
jgi:hypothetical protein